MVTRSQNTWLFAFLAGCLCVAACPVITNYYRQYYREREPFFGAPVAASLNTIHIRNDGYGKGHFGASRNGRRVHRGIDLITQVGQPVLAAKSGRVAFAQDAKGYGLSVDILHPDGLLTRYAHLSSLEVRTGQWVSKEARLGKSGKTGNAANPRIAPHLHFEIRDREIPLNPTAGLIDPSIVVR